MAIKEPRGEAEGDKQKEGERRCKEYREGEALRRGTQEEERHIGDARRGEGEERNGTKKGGCDRHISEGKQVERMMRHMCIGNIMY